MSLPIRPIISALLRNRTGALLVAFQIAIALAVLVNAIYIVKQRSDKINHPTGMDVPNILVISSSGFTQGFDNVAAIRDDLGYLRSLDAVIAASPSNSVPLSGHGSATNLYDHPNGGVGFENGNVMEVDEQGVAALGLHLVAGRTFRREEILPPSSTSSFVPEVILTQEMANNLFPNQNALGKTVYSPLSQSATVVGIVERMQASFPSFGHLDSVFLIPRLPFSFSGAIYYIVRTKPGTRDSVARTIEEHLTQSNPNRLIDWIRPLARFRDRTYAADRNTEVFLVMVTALIVAISALGIFGLATFNVSTRTKQIGTRRAIGARRGDILRYFMVENAMITTTGIGVGCALALAVGYWLSLQYQLPRLDLYYLVAGVPVLWAVGQLAVWQPARRASKVSPSVATRTV